MFTTRPSEQWLCLLVALGIFTATLTARAPDWTWLGALTEHSADLQTGWRGSDMPPPLTLRAVDGSEIRTIYPVRLGTYHEELGQTALYRLTELQPDTRYSVFWKRDAPNRPFSRSFRTFPSGKTDFSFAFGSCAATGSNSPVFAAILDQQPDFFLHTGDLHYEDISHNETSRFYAAYAKALRAPQQHALFHSLPVFYMWDDHDFGPNNSDSTSPSRLAALSSYRSVVPHFPLALDADFDAPVAQAFTVGRVRFILTDLRSARSPNKAEDGPGKSMLGPQQLDWFKQELMASARSHALIIWVSSVPWIADDDSNDRWSGFSHERKAISDFIVDNGVTNLLMLSGDAHMLAADDGSNNRYSSDGKGPGFPVYHAAALDRRGSEKGGPYSLGSFPGGHQFGLVTIKDQGDTIAVRFAGRNSDGEVLLEHAFTRPVRLGQPE
jgi:phosphodiesterase/alkaline phosphatase D-like protein